VDGGSKRPALLKGDKKGDKLDGMDLMAGSRSQGQLMYPALRPLLERSRRVTVVACNYDGAGERL
jgi:hypothetical protein